MYIDEVDGDLVRRGFYRQVGTDEKSGRNLGDRGECARCRNGDLPMRRCGLGFGSPIY